MSSELGSWERWHSVHLPPFCWGGVWLTLQPQFPKGELGRISTFRTELLGKRGGDLFEGEGAQFLHKK